MMDSFITFPSSPPPPPLPTSVQTKQRHLTGSWWYQPWGQTSTSLSTLIPPNVIPEMPEKFIAVETQPGTSWLLLRGRVNTEGAPFGQTV